MGDRRRSWRAGLVGEVLFVQRPYPSGGGLWLSKVRLRLLPAPGHVLRGSAAAAGFLGTAEGRTRREAVERALAAAERDAAVLFFELLVNATLALPLPTEDEP